MDPRVAALRHGTVSPETFVAVIVNAPQRRIVPRLGRAELGAGCLRIPPEMGPKLCSVFREGARDASTHGVKRGSVSYVLLERSLNVGISSPSYAS